MCQVDKKPCSHTRINMVLKKFRLPNIQDTALIIISTHSLLVHADKLNTYPTTIICPQNFVCFYICCIFSSALQTKFFFMEANNMNPDQTAPLGSIHIVCNIGFLGT